MTLPLILAGPILRRVEPRSVSVWIALRTAGTVTLDVYSGTVDVGSDATSVAQIPGVASRVATGSSPTIRLGEQLHLAVTTATVGTGLPLAPGGLHCYNVTIQASGGTTDLRKEGLLAGQTVGPASHQYDVDALGYADGLLPGFGACPASLDDLVLLHASCNKLHGPGAFALAFVDSIIESNKDDGAKRPHQLFLTGDQIYADDVATALLPALSSLGHDLLGVDEQIPGPQQQPGTFTAGTADFPAGRRQKLMAVAGFSSTDADNHLLSFGEYAAMYLVSWNPMLWPQLAKAPATAAGADTNLQADIARDAGSEPPGAPEVLNDTAGGPEQALTPLFAAGDDSAKELHRVAARFLDHKKQLDHDVRRAVDNEDSTSADDARHYIWHVRRALANVPTYMICDDHEVTDDWFITRAWRNRVLADPLGRTVIRNGVVSYVLFQGWGNDPSAWSAGPRQSLLTAATTLFPSGQPGPASAASSSIDAALGLSPGAEPQFDFSFSVPGAAHLVRVLDTRTRREYQGDNSPPGLLTPQALDQQLPLGPLAAGLDALVVVSPAPVLGWPLMEEMIAPVGAAKTEAANAIDTILHRERLRKTAVSTGIVPHRVTGSEDTDAEAWSVDPEAFQRFLARLATYANVVILAGDVHFAGSYACDYQRSGAAPSRIVQLISSATRNEWPWFVEALFSQHQWTRVIQRLGTPATYAGWNDPIPSVLADGGVGDYLSLRGKAVNAPVVLPVDGWRASHPLSRAPEWLYSIEQVFDDRAAADRPPHARPEEITAPDLPPFPAGGPPLDLLHPSAGVLGYSGLAQIHADSVEETQLSRGLVFPSNVGQVTFHTEGDGRHVTHSLLTLRRHPDPNEGPDAYTEHDILLTAAPIAAPTHVGP